MLSALSPGPDSGPSPVPLDGESRVVPDPSSRRNGVGAACAALLHGSALAALLLTPTQPPRPLPRETLMLVDFVAVAPPPPPAAAPQPEPPAPRRIEPPPEPRAQPKPQPPRPSAPRTTPAPPKPAAAEPAPLPVAEAPPLSAVAASSEASADTAAEASAPPATVGGTAEASQTPPVPVKGVTGLDNPKPLYPRMARRKGWQGLVILNVWVDESGAARTVALFRSSGHDVLDESALETVKSWRFVPARRGGQNVAAAVQVPIRFTLESDG